MNIRFPNRNFTLNDFETSSEGVKEFCDPIKDVLDKKFENVQANDSMEQNELGEDNFNDVMDLLIIQNAATVYGENLVYGQVPEENMYEYLGKILILKEFGSEDTKVLLENMVKILQKKLKSEMSNLIACQKIKQITLHESKFLDIRSQWLETE